MTPPDPLTIAVVLIGATLALLFLVLRARIPAFFALILIALSAGLLLGMPPDSVIQSIKDGMGGVLGFVAVIVGLGAILGAILEHSGGVARITDAIAKSGDRGVPWKMSVLGLLIAIPVFFDVALVILIPVVVRLAKRIGQATIYVAGPLLAGLAAAHAFIPPTPGPIAVAALVNADIGLVIIFGVIAAIPAILFGGVAFAELRLKQVSGPVDAPNLTDDAPQISPLAAVLALAVPILLVALGTIWSLLAGETATPDFIRFVSHPFVALLLTVGVYWAYANVVLKLSAATLNTASMKALEPAGIVVLVTGAGGALKQVLIDSEAGARIAEMAASLDISLLVFGFLIAALVRVVQGSATVAMITAAGFTAPLLDLAATSDQDRALLVIAIAGGASVLSHVNDSGFWLVNRYLDQSVAETLKTWTIISTLVGLTGFLTALVLSMLV